MLALELFAGHFNFCLKLCLQEWGVSKSSFASIVKSKKYINLLCIKR